MAISLELRLRLQYISQRWSLVAYTPSSAHSSTVVAKLVLLDVSGAAVGDAGAGDAAAEDAAAAGGAAAGAPGVGSANKALSEL